MCISCDIQGHTQDPALFRVPTGKLPCAIVICRSSSRLVQSFALRVATGLVPPPGSCAKWRRISCLSRMPAFHHPAHAIRVLPPSALHCLYKYLRSSYGQWMRHVAALLACVVPFLGSCADQKHIPTAGRRVPHLRFPFGSGRSLSTLVG